MISFAARKLKPLGTYWKRLSGLKSLSGRCEEKIFAIVRIRNLDIEPVAIPTELSRLPELNCVCVNKSRLSLVSCVFHLLSARPSCCVTMTGNFLFDRLPTPAIIDICPSNWPSCCHEKQRRLL
jgi:hypothetical protein